MILYVTNKVELELELLQLVHQKESVQKNHDEFVNRISLRTVCLRLWITGNNAVNNVQFLAQTDCFASYDLIISSGAMEINFMLPACIFLTLKVPVTIDLHFINHQEAQFQLKSALLFHWTKKKLPVSWVAWGRVN